MFKRQNRSYANAEQQAFVERWLLHYRRQGDARGLLGFFCVILPLAISSIFLAHPMVREAIVTVQCLLAVVALIFYRLKVLAPLSHITAPLMWSLITWGTLYLLQYFLDHGVGPASENVFRCVLGAIVAQVCVMACFGYSRHSAVLRTLSLGSTTAIFAVISWNNETSLYWPLAMFTVGASAFFVAHKLESQTIVNIEREFHFNRQMAPKHLLRHILPGDNDLQSRFKPMERTCLCLSSDWRNYQRLTGSLTPSDLALLLNDYYDRCDRVLNQALPDGNYYTDWIADELFVVIYAMDEQSNAGMADAGVKAALGLIEEKARFAQDHAFDLAIDVGLAYGTAYVGLMGPTGFPKTTALGVTPGRSRRMQTLGKMLRQEIDAQDRVIFGRDTLMELHGPFTVHEWQATTEAVKRDLENDEIFYIDTRVVARDLKKSA